MLARRWFCRSRQLAALWVFTEPPKRGLCPQSFAGASANAEASRRGSKLSVLKLKELGRRGSNAWVAALYPMLRAKPYQPLLHSNTSITNDPCPPFNIGGRQRRTARHNTSGYDPGENPFGFAF